MKNNRNGGKYIKWGLFMTFLTASFAFTILVGGFLWNRTEVLEAKLDTLKDVDTELKEDVSAIKAHVEWIRDSLTSAEITSE